MEGGDEGGKNGRSGGSAGRKEDPGNNTPSKKGEIDRSLDELSGVIDGMLDEQSDGRGGAAQGSGAGERASEAGNRPEQDQRRGDQGGIRAEEARSIPQGAGSGAGAEMATRVAQGVAGHFQEAGADEEGRQGAGGAEEGRQGAGGAEEGRQGAGGAEGQDLEAGAQQGGAEEDGSAGPDPIPNPVIESILGPSEIDAYDGGVGGGRRGAGGEHGERGRVYAYEEFIDERILISRDAFGKKEMKIKVLEVSDEKAPTSWKLGDRVKVNKILVTVKHLETQQVEEGELDIEAVEKEIARERHYSSTNRWVPTADIKNGYVAGSRHTSLISDAVALDYITF